MMTMKGLRKIHRETGLKESFRAWLRSSTFAKKVGELPSKARWIVGTPNPNEVEERKTRRDKRQVLMAERMRRRHRRAAGTFKGRNKDKKGKKKQTIRR